MIRSRRKIFATSMFLVALGSSNCAGAPAGSQTEGYRQPAASEPLVIQGRITTLQGAVVTVKTPDAYPGGPGIHAQVVVAGPTFKVDISRARLLLPDGRQADTLPLAVGNRVLMVLSGPASGSPAPNGPGNVSQTYSASTIERIVDSDKIITH
jgi:hypothetical protein